MSSAKKEKSDLFEWLKVNAHKEMFPDKVYFKFLDFFENKFGIGDNENSTTKEKINFELTNLSIKEVQKECASIRLKKNKRRAHKFVPDDKNGNKITKKTPKTFFMENEYKPFTEKDKTNSKFFINGKFHLTKYKSVKYEEFQKKNKKKFKQYEIMSKKLEEIFEQEYKKQAKPKKACNSFIIYVKSDYAITKFKKQYPNEKITGIKATKLYSLLWDKETIEVKEKFKKESKELSEQRKIDRVKWEENYAIKKEENTKIKKSNVVDNINDLVLKTNLNDKRDENTNINEDNEELTEEEEKALEIIKQNMFDDITRIITESMPTFEEIAESFIKSAENKILQDVENSKLT
jgi:hypothetical protein